MHPMNKKPTALASSNAHESLCSQGLPERCSKGEFAALLDLHPSAVSRYKTAGRLVMTADGRVVVRESLARLAATWDPQKGGRGGGGINAPDGGTLTRIQGLLAMAPAGGGQGEAAKLRAELAAVREELAEAARVADWYLAARESGAVVGMEEVHERADRLAWLLRESLPEAVAAHAEGAKAWELFMARLMARTVWAWDEATFREHVAEFYGDDWEPEEAPESLASW